MTLILNNEEIRQALNVKDCLDVMEEAYCERASSRTASSSKPAWESPAPSERKCCRVLIQKCSPSSARADRPALTSAFSLRSAPLNGSRSIAQIPITAKLSLPQWKDKPGSRREKGRTAIGRGCLDSPVSGGCEIL